jgi:signal transduction histidine kinase
VITNVTSGINWDTISDHKKINIYRSLQELLVNMKKYSKATEVTVIFKSEGKRHFINYTDDGVGFILKDVRKRGLQNVETRIKNIQGSVTFITSKGKGFKAHLYF